MPIFAILFAVLGLGAFWVYVVPALQNYVPASFSTNRWAQLAVTGAFLFITVLVVGAVLKFMKVPKVAAV